MGVFSASIALFLVTYWLHPGPSSAQQMIPIPGSILQQLADFGTNWISAEVQKVQKTFSDAQAAFEPVNQTCNSLLQAKTDRCYSCVGTSCKQRGEKACKPSEWEAILSKGEKFLTKNLFSILTGTFFVNEMGKAVVNVGKGIENVGKTVVKGVEKGIEHVGKEIGHGVEHVGKEISHGLEHVGKEIGHGLEHVGKEIGHSLEHVGKEIGHGVEHVGKEIGHGVVHVGKEIGHGVVHVGEEIGHGVEHVGKEIGHGLSHVGDEIGKGIHHLSHEFHHIFGRRRRGFGRRASEPGCDAIKDGSGCNYYYDTCADCTLNPDQDCPGFKAAADNYRASYETQLLLENVQDWTYKVISVNVDRTSFDPVSMGFKKVEATVVILGKSLKFWASQPVNPNDSETAAPVLAMQAWNLFKAV